MRVWLWRPNDDDIGASCCRCVRRRRKQNVYTSQERRRKKKFRSWRISALSSSSSPSSSFTPTAMINDRRCSAPKSPVYVCNYHAHSVWYLYVSPHYLYIYLSPRHVPERAFLVLLLALPQAHETQFYGSSIEKRG